jgi:hypothetical protein
MRIAEIEALKLSDMIAQAIEKHFGEVRSHALKAENNDAGLSVDENFYNRIMFDLNEGESEPSLTEMLNALAVVKTELIEARVSELMGSVDSSYFQRWGYEQGLIYNEVTSYIKNKAIQDDDAFFASLGVSIDEYKAEEARDALVNHGKAVKSVCEKTLNFITGMNASKGLTAEQIDTLQTSYEAVEDALRKQRPMKAVSLLSAVAPIDGIVSQEEIDSVVVFLTAELQTLVG